MLASELLCFLPALPASPAFALRRKRSPSDLVDLTDLLSFDYTLRLSPKAAFSVLSGCTRAFAFLPRSSSTPPPMSLKSSKGVRRTSTGSVSKCREICLRSEACKGLLISIEGNFGVERADCGSSCLSPKENCRPYRLPRIPLQIQLFARIRPAFMPRQPAPLSRKAYNNSMLGSRERDATSPRIGSTAGFLNTRYSPRRASHAFSDPYATVQLDGRTKQVSNAFARIGRVERMIRQQKMELQVQLPEEEWPADTHSLRPQFKVRTSKQHSRKGREQAGSPHRLHLQNLSLECSPSEPTAANENRGRSFQQTLKNRRRMHLRPVRRSRDVSLLEMLNRISEGSPLQRYKALGGKVGSFLQ